MKYGLVLEGGGMRGAYTAGCLSWLLQNNIQFDHSCAISATAVFLVYYTSKDLDALKNLGVKLMSDPNNTGLRPFFREGTAVGYKYMFDHLLKNEAPINLDKLVNTKTKMEIGAYQMEGEKLVWVNNQMLADDMRYLKASCVLPLAGHRVKIGDYNYIDGGIKTMMPIFRSLEVENDRFFCITTKHASYVREPNGRFLAKLLAFVYRKFPNMVKDANENRVAFYNNEMTKVDELIKDKKALLMRPSVLFNVSRLKADKEDLTALFQQGVKDCEDRKAEIFEFFGIKNA